MITLELLYTTLYQHGCPANEYAEWVPESLTYNNAHITIIHDALIL